MMLLCRLLHLQVCLVPQHRQAAVLGETFLSQMRNNSFTLFHFERIVSAQYGQACQRHSQRDDSWSRYFDSICGRHTIKQGRLCAAHVTLIRDLMYAHKTFCPFLSAFTQPASRLVLHRSTGTCLFMALYNGADKHRLCKSVTCCFINRVCVCKARVAKFQSTSELYDNVCPIKSWD